MLAILELATNISTPLMLAGFFAGAFFLVTNQIISKNVIPLLSRNVSGTIITLIINRLFVLSLVAMVLGFSGFVVKNVFPDSITTEQNLSESIDKWLEEVDKSQESKTVSAGSPLPTTLMAARNRVELDWKNASLSERKKQDAEKTWRALSYLCRIYKITEHDSSSKNNALFWADEEIQYFEELQNRRLLTEALQDKASIYLDIARMGNNDKQQFEKAARAGDTLMARAAQLADKDQLPSVLRMSSSFYYNLARPKSFRLSESWDNNYLLLAYEKMEEAYALAPDDSKNANQLARTTIKASKNPPQDSDKEWTQSLRFAQQAMKKAWEANKDKRIGLHSRLSSLNVLGVVTLETIVREWRELPAAEHGPKSSAYLSELDADSLAPLREAAALLQNSELRKAYGFDLYYDISRALAIKTAILRTLSANHEQEIFKDLKSNLAEAKENAKTSQLESAVKDIDMEPAFTLLSEDQRQELRELLSINGIGK